MIGKEIWGSDAPTREKNASFELKRKEKKKKDGSGRRIDSDERSTVIVLSRLEHFGEEFNRVVLVSCSARPFRIRTSCIWYFATYAA